MLHTHNYISKLVWLPVLLCFAYLVGCGCFFTGYEGDSSDPDEDGAMMSYNESISTVRRCLPIPDFWQILRLNSDKVEVYFHARYLAFFQHLTLPYSNSPYLTLPASLYLGWIVILSMPLWFSFWLAVTFCFLVQRHFWQQVYQTIQGIVSSGYRKHPTALPFS